MRMSIRFFALLVLVLSLSIWGSLSFMERLEDQWLVGDLDRRSALITESVHEFLVDSLTAGKKDSIQRLLNRISKDERLMGALVCSPAGVPLAKTDALSATFLCLSNEQTGALKKRSFFQFGETKVHRGDYPLTNDAGEIVATLSVFHDTSYMGRRHATTRTYIVVLLVGISIFFALMGLIIYRWTIGNVVLRFRYVVKDLLRGDLHTLNKRLERSEFSHLIKDVSKVMRELRFAKDLVNESSAQTTWTPSRLRADVQKFFGDSQLCVIANREPYVHNRKGGKIEVLFPASGLVTAVEPIVRACSGLWIAHGSGTADRETADLSGKLLVPPGNSEYVLKRVWLSKAEEQGYYYGFSNEGMWPLCHIAHARPHFDSRDWEQYLKVNQKFADNFIEEKWTERPVVLIQDYHFALLPQMIREKMPEAVSSLFWHIPWPNPEAFGICPWKKELLLGMLGADLIGFHTQFHCNNFLDTVDRFLEARVDREQFSVTVKGHVCYVKPFPISVDWPSRHDLPVDEFDKERRELLMELNLPEHVKIGVGVDRVDYTKGLIERMTGVERMLEKHPEWVGKFVFVQIGAPSRTHIKRYQDLNAEVQEVADRINWKFSHAEVPPIMLRLAHHNAAEVHRFYRAADLCFVSSLHDGMNLVAKEYVTARNDEDGVLILSHFAGAARELNEALLVNPYSLDECADALYQALTMSQNERRERMKRLRTVVADKNVYQWAASFLAEVHRIGQLRKNIGQ